MRYEDWKYHPSKLPESPPEMDKVINGLEAQFLEELKKDERVAEYMEPYDPTWVESFLGKYAEAKAHAVRYSKYYLDRIQASRELRHREETEQAYEAILHKKLFNLQCLWHAEQLTLPGILCSWDFLDWERNIMSCPFLEPATDEELEVMRQFLRTCDDAVDWPYEWNNYDEMKQKDEDGLYSSIPEWYEFYDSLMGTGALIDLPDIRGPKEEYYMDLWRAENKRQREAKQAENPASPAPPQPQAIFCSLEERYSFATAIDDEIFQQIFKLDLDQHEERKAAEEESGTWDAEDVILTHLSSVRNPPPVRGGLDWRQAIVQCWYDYLAGVIAEDIDMLREEHALYFELGVWPAVDDRKNYYGEMREWILEGRELAGEPRDFNF